MKSKYLIGTFLSAALCSTAVHAEETEERKKFYLGMDAFTGSGELELDTNFGADSTSDHDNSGTGLKIGFILSTGNRLEFSLTSIELDYDGGSSTRVISGLDADLIFPFGSSELSPFLGLGLGHYTYENTASIFTDNEDMTGISVNFAAGVLYSVDEFVELEAAYKVKTISWEELESMGLTVESTTTMHNFLVGIKVKF